MRRILATIFMLPLAACGGGGGGAGGGGAPVVPSSDATLAGLSASAGALSPSFAPATTSYTVAAGTLASAVSVTPVASHPVAVIRVDGVVVASGAASAWKPLAAGAPLPVNIEVTAENGTVRTYAVVVTRSEANTLAQRAYVKASNTGQGDGFGWSVAMSDDTLVVGAPFEDGGGLGIDPPDDNLHAAAGAVYVYVRTAGVWSFQACLKSARADSSFFGNAVAISGDTLAVGVPSSSGTVNSTGTVSVFVRAGASWSQQALLEPPSDVPWTTGFPNFGGSVAVSGETIVVGTVGDDGVVDDSGAAYVFVRSGTTWSQQGYLKALNPGTNDNFGAAVAVSGNTVVVGASAEDGSGSGVNPPDDDAATDAGAAYVFVRTGTSWTQQAYVKATNPDPDDQFGGSVGISGDTLVVGAILEAGSGLGINPPDDDAATFRGAAYVYVRLGSNWGPQAYLKSSNSTASLFGSSVSVSGDTILVGAERELGSGVGINPPTGAVSNGAGAAYAFVRGSGVWSQVAYIKASNTGTDDRFGTRVSVSGDTAVVSAVQEDGSGIGVNPASNELAADAGAVYVFR